MTARGKDSTKIRRMATSPLHSESSSSYDTSSADGDHEKAIAKGGVLTPFPWKLHDMLDSMADKGDDSIVCWQPHGRAFMVHKPKEFVAQIMSHFFNQTKYASFQRQLNLYGFSRLSHGLDKGAYYHKCFVRGQRNLCRGMIRQKIKGTKVRRSLAPEEEPNFYAPEYNQTNKTMLQQTQPPPPPPMSTRKLVAISKAPSPKKMQKIKTDPVDCTPQTSLVNMMRDTTAQLSQHSVIPPPSVRQGSGPPQLVVCPQVIPSSSTNHHVKGGDLLFFEGRPFRYLEHLEEVPSTPQSQYFHPALSGMISNIVAMEATSWQTPTNGQEVYSQ